MSENHIQTSDTSSVEGQRWKSPPRHRPRHYEYEVDGLDDTRFDLFSALMPSALGWLAEEAADDFFSNHDGWEWSWPATITVFEHNKKLGRFEVGLEHRPSFDAYEVLPAEAA